MAEPNPNSVPIDRKKLRTLRTRALMTRAKLAARSGVSVAEIAKIENGQRLQPRLDTIAKLITGLGCTLEDLEPDDEEPAA